MREPVLSPAALDKLLDDIEADALEEAGARSDEHQAVAVTSPAALHAAD